MRCRRLLPVAMLIAATPAPPFPSGTRFAILATASGGPVRNDALIARARAAIGRAPGAVARLHTEGTLPGHGIRDASEAASHDQAVALDLALAWRLTGERAFADAAARDLDAWASVYRTSFNPIDETGFDRLMLADDLVHDTLAPAPQARLDAFWRRMARGYLDDLENTTRSSTSTNNWQSHRVKLATLAAFRTGDPVLVARARAAFRRQVAVNIRPDGSTLDYRERDALHYVTYDLDPLLTAALAARAHGEDWYGWRAPSGAGLAAALDWLAPYARGERVQIEFVRSQVTFDRARAAAGDGDYAPHPWNPAGAVPTFAFAARLDPRFAALLADLERRTGRRPPPWIALVPAR